MRKYVMTVSDCCQVNIRLEFINEKVTASQNSFNVCADEAMKYAIEKDLQKRMEKYGSNKMFLKHIDYDWEDIVEHMKKSGYVIKEDTDVLYYDFNEDRSDDYSDDMGDYIFDRTERILAL
jgi:hypothetical protein